ncbi:hypothetical protein Tco_1345595 [Tanacetum coccineum]
MSSEEPAPQMAPVESPQIVSTVKLPILKKGEYTLWSMRMEQYLTNTNYGLWQVILNGDGPIQVTKDDNGIETKVPPKTAQAILARQRERKAKSILLLAIPDEYQLRFHAIKDAQTLNKDGIDDLDIDDLYNNLKVFEADIKGSSGSSSNSLNVAFLSAEDTSSSNEVNIANGVSTAASHSSQGQASSSSYADDLIGIRPLCVKLGIRKNSINLAFLSSENTSSTNEVSTASGDFRVSTAGGISQVSSTPCAHDVACSFFAQPTTSPQLENEDFQQIDEDDLEELDLRWQVAMLTVRVRKFIQKTGRNMDFKEK